MKEGMYLRHSGLDGEYPIIQKIIKLETPGRCGGEYKVYTDKSRGWFIDSDYIEIEKSKYSFNIIDLIEVGDYVNGYKVTYVYPNLLKVDSADIWEIHSSDIKSIVTKEQFSQMEYKIEEK